jgi:hypothetical protein
MADLIEDWIAALPPSLHARRTQPLVVAWGFGAGPSFIGVHREPLVPARSIVEMLEVVRGRRGVLRRAHLELVDGSRVLIEPGADGVRIRYTGRVRRSAATGGR